MSVALAKVESWEDHVEAWHHLGREVDGAAWRRATIAASLKGRYGEGAVEKFAKEVGFSAQSLYQFARTFEVFPEKSARAENLTFYHHLRAAVLTASAVEAKAAVEQAEREGWSANALRAYLRPPTPPASLPAASCDSETDTCGPTTDKDRTVHIAGLVEALYQSMVLFESCKTYDVDALIERGTKKSVKELLRKANQITKWLESLKESSNRRIR